MFLFQTIKLSPHLQQIFNIMKKFREEELKTRNSTRPCTSHTITPHYTLMQSLQNSRNLSPDNIETSFITTPQLNNNSFKRYQSAHHKVKLIKTHLSSLKQQYQKRVTHKRQIQNSITKKNKQLSTTRRDFLKLFESKKAHFKQIEIENERVKNNKENERIKRSKTRERKLVLELQSMVCKQQLENSRLEMRNQNKRSKIFIQEKLEEAKQEQLQNKKKLFQSRKQQAENLKTRNKFRQEYIREKGKQRYMDRVQRELNAINQYEAIIQNVESWVPSDENEGEIQFFVTKKQDQKIN